MDDQPEQPADEAADLHRADLGHGPEAGDGGQRAQVAVVERPWPACPSGAARWCGPRGRPTAWPPRPRPGGRPAPSGRPPRRSRGDPGSEQSGSTMTRPARSSSAPAASARREPRARPACRPPRPWWPRRSLVSSRPVLVISTPSSSMSGDHGAEMDLDPHPGQVAPVRRDSRRPMVPTSWSLPSTRTTRVVARIDAPVVAPEGPPRQLVELAGHLDARGAAADDHEGHQGAGGPRRRPPPPPARRRRRSARAGTARRRATSCRDALRTELVVTEVGGRGAAGHDQAVVGDGHGWPNSSAWTRRASTSMCCTSARTTRRRR